MRITVDLDLRTCSPRPVKGDVADAFVKKARQVAQGYDGKSAVHYAAWAAIADAVEAAAASARARRAEA